MALGVGWPPRKGWKHRIVGKTVDPDLLTPEYVFERTRRLNMEASKNDLSECLLWDAELEPLKEWEPKKKKKRQKYYRPVCCPTTF